MSVDSHKGKINFVLFLLAIVIVITFFFLKIREADSSILTSVGLSDIDVEHVSLDAGKVQESASSTTDSATTTPKGSYKSFTPEKLVGVKEGVKVILFFDAPWSPASEVLDSTIGAASLPEGLIIFDVDYDKYSDLRKKYSITTPPSFVEVNVAGDVIKKWTSKQLTELLKTSKI